MKHFKDEIDNIKIPDIINDRVRVGVEMAENERKKKKKSRQAISLAAVAASIVIIIGSVGALNETFASAVKGYFSDIKKWDGTVTGTEFNQASNDIKVTSGEISIEQDNVIIPIEVEILDKMQAPYALIEVLSISQFEIRDSEGKLLDPKYIRIVSNVDIPADYTISNEQNLLEEVKLENDKKRIFKADLVIPTVDNIEVFISSFQGQAKADAPITINGDWKINVTTN
ncbi:DUF4179 domain-containing protein [Paenibacillus gallinarum]|uniref:DUF4179 domain-containing protein n=1 Tax=Paenibacillus gallinarum TaxID=2762232 RepID=A0ABR8SSG8_9BACL|nr:DUF4179 domain-containing protein [Paenibacillus gallinarum]MBD7966443.1 DUF4179 domain-containing protein [Paenibacillus gallinarum]